VTLGDGASLAHAGHGRDVLTALRGVALSLLRRAGHHTVTARLRYHGQPPEEPIAFALSIFR